MQIGTGFSENTDHIKAVKEAFSRALPGVNREKIDLVLLFSTVRFNHPLILKTLSELSGDIPLLGLTSPSIMLNQRVCKQGLAIVLFSFPEDIYLNTACIKNITKENAAASGEKLGEDLLYGCKGIRRNLSMVFSSGYIPDGQNVILGLQKRVGRSFPLVGSSSLSSIYYGSSSLNNAACGILFGGKLNFGLSVKHGWHPLGKPREVTLSSGNIIHEIDGKPADSLYKDYFAKDTSGLKKDLKYISSLYPLGVAIAERKEYLLRNLSSIEDSGALNFDGDIPQGSQVRLMISSKEYCLESTKEAAVLARQSLKNQEAKFILVFNSLSRLMVLGRQEGEEIEAIKEVFGKDVPLLGVYTMAEQAPLNLAGYLGRPYFYNKSIAILAMAG
ncbi:MAG: FIST C-terminal domain-containing protein [Candidatus Omnitrophica bacterium]|nr:FIST C-terminal domain-containing protein [Candidatus Omnitrophota bacterium]